MEELNGTQPLKIAPPPKVLGYSRTLAKVKAPEKQYHHKQTVYIHRHDTLFTSKHIR